MPYPRITFRYPRILEGIILSRRKSVGYDTISSYIMGLIVEDVVKENPHDVGLLAQDFPQRWRDDLHEKMLTPEGREIIRGWFS